MIRVLVDLVKNLRSVMEMGRGVEDLLSTCQDSVYAVQFGSLRLVMFFLLCLINYR